MSLGALKAEASATVTILKTLLVRFLTASFAIPKHRTFGGL
jgi:hypothetical protein